MSRFDYVAYDTIAADKQARLKKLAQGVEAALNDLEAARAGLAAAIRRELGCGTQRDRALEHLTSAQGLDLNDSLAELEESYMWCGKAIRDDQIERNGSAPLQEARNNE